ncbi:MAG: [NiFe] hydrogenase small subunit HydA [Geobacteraceae bacterium GWC2_58_44]|nr:MAG: [NiFe] hydrogenase small subunit HydA [Geobacteraceae bacterium GWC2_58_44]HBG04743.1 [NiFe] hydrogenase small subunit HydA [Geobacter sp.]
MQINRRDFLKWAAATAAVLGLSPQDLLKVEEALAAATSPPVIWLQGSSCTGCSVAALNVVQPATIDDILINKISMKYHPTLMAAGGDAAIQAMDQAALGNAGQFILVVEGGVSTANNGNYCIIGERNGVPVTMLEAVNTLGPKAKHVIAVGTCASYKGIPGAGSNLVGISPLKTVLTGKTLNPVISIPGCPAPPESVFGAIVTILSGKSVALDAQSRPKAYYGDKIHSTCYRRGTGSAPTLGTATGCFKNFGCVGPGTNQNCPSRKWNNGKNWCIGSGQMCIGCSNSTFPQSPIFKFGSYA